MEIPVQWASSPLYILRLEFGPLAVRIVRRGAHTALARLAWQSGLAGPDQQVRRGPFMPSVYPCRSFLPAWHQSPAHTLTQGAPSPPALAGSCAAPSRLVPHPRLQREKLHELAQALRLHLDRCTGGGGFLYERRILLRHLVHLYHRLVDLLDASSLLLTGGGNLRDNITHLLDSRDGRGQRLPRLIDQVGAALDLLPTVYDQRLDLLGRLCTALGQLAHFRRHHRKATALLAGACRFDRRIEGQKIGLEGNAIDDARDLGNFPTTMADGGHRGHGLAHHTAALLGLGARADRQLIRLAGVVGVLLHGAGHLLHAGGRFFQGGGLFLRTLAQISVTLGELGGCRTEHEARFADLCHDLLQPFTHTLEAVGEHILVGSGDHLDGQIPIAEGF